MTKKNTNSLYEFRSRRIRRSFAFEGRKLTQPTDVARLLLYLTKELDREHFFAFYLSAKGALIGYETVAIGGLTGVEVHPREVFRGAVLAGAFAVIIAHNHPSGNSSPSNEDRALTRRLAEVGDLIGIPVYDHIIAGHEASYSFAQQGEI
tara:strand:- start:41 stop:490 length:450 start_codon:yes stop_codon:yes gene_type:complete